ncbi:hypothetical protein [Nocardioides alcanivorans]|nr:hypothetical protein [Nocardioides alcanivorans]
MTTLAAALALAGAYVLWRTDPDTRRWYLTLAADVILRRTP